VRRAILITAIALSMGVSGNSFAATAPVQAVAPQPQQFGDWTVRCISAKSLSPCEMNFATVRKGTKQRVTGVSIAFVPARNQFVMQIAVPLGVSLAKGLVITSDTYTSGRFFFRRCDRSGCYVETAISSDAIDALKKSASSDATMNVATDGGRAVSLKLSLRGLADASAAMTDLAKKNASAH
jgi:invasion protein IalB